MWKDKYYKEFYHAGIKGMKWGVRRYQNADGTLTEAGKRRYARDLKGLSKKQKDKYEGDADKWVKEDMERTKKLADSSKNLADTLNSSVQNSGVRKKTRMDLTHMTDQEMRNRINRELLERQYNDIFAPQKVSRGKEFMSKTLSAVGTTLGIAGSALGVALAIKELKG